MPGGPQVANQTQPAENQQYPPHPYYTQLQQYPPQYQLQEPNLQPQTVVYPSQFAPPARPATVPSPGCAAESGP